MKNLTVLLPTFNEKGNVVPLVQRIRQALKEKNWNYEILFIDDSNDETPQVIQKLMRENPQIRLVCRKKEERTGLATAFLTGFALAQGEYICCLDSDLQHPPETIPCLLEKAYQEGADLVVATRYARGGSAVGLGSLKTVYGIYRRAVSLGFKYFTQILFIPTRKTSDPLGGFFLLKKELVKGISFQPKGFKILVEILMRTKPNKVAEVPYVFLARENDQSKANLRQGLEFLRHLWVIFRTVPEAGRFIKFCLVGFSGVLINLGVLAFLVEILAWEKSLAWFWAVIISIFSNFLLNNLFTYSDRQTPSRKESLKRVAYYYLISFLGMGVNFVFYRIFLEMGFNYLLAALIGIVAATGTNFYLATKVVWRIKV